MLPKGRVDVALALDSYHHFDYPEKMLAGLRKGSEARRQAGDRGVLQERHSHAER